MLVLLLLHFCISFPVLQNKEEELEDLDINETSQTDLKKDKLSDSLIFSPLDTATLWAAHVSKLYNKLGSTPVSNSIFQVHFGLSYEKNNFSSG